MLFILCIKATNNKYGNSLIIKADKYKSNKRKEYKIKITSKNDVIETNKILNSFFKSRFYALSILKTVNYMI